MSLLEGVFLDDQGRRDEDRVRWWKTVENHVDDGTLAAPTQFY